MNKKMLFINCIAIIIILTAFNPVKGVNNTNISMINSETLIFSGNILYVGGNGPGNYSKIQDAIENASDTDTVFVYSYSSPYFENIVINVTINLVGESRYNTVIDAERSGHVVVINSYGVKISGFTIRNGGGLGGTGIRIKSDNCEIFQNNISANNWYGIYVSSSYNTFLENDISDNDFGIWLGGHSNNFIHDCQIMDNSNGIVLDRSSHNNISRNNITFNSRGVDLYYNSKHNEIFNNFVDGNPWGIGLYSNYGSTCYNVIKRNIVSNGKGGIELQGKSSGILSYNIVTENNVTNNEGGILLRHYTSNNVIYHNNLINNINPWSEEPNNAFDYGVDNLWYNITLEEGNYWDDYKEKYPYSRPRLTRPWIWNMPYTIEGEGGGKDKFPLVKEYDESICINIQQLQSISQKSFSNQQQSYQSQQTSQQPTSQTTKQV